MGNVFFSFEIKAYKWLALKVVGWPKTLREIFDCSQNKTKLYGTSMCSQENCSLT
jgi:hypothetical protein